jgi:hypothetical protein
MKQDLATMNLKACVCNCFFFEQMKNKDSVLCSKCDFRYQCLGSDADRMSELIEDKELELMLLRREEISPIASEYDKIDKVVKKAVKGKEEAVIGDFLITGKSVPRNGYTVEATEYWKTNIIYKGLILNKTNHDEE